MAKSDANQPPWDPRARSTQQGFTGVDDGTLIAACLDNDQSAWRELVARYSRLVYSIPVRYGIAEATADDVHQVVFEILLRQLPNLRDPSSLPKWLITATHRACWRATRQQGQKTSPWPVAVDASAPPLEQIISWERQHAVRLGLRHLGGQCEALLTALFLDPTQPSYEQISTRLGMPQGSIGPTRARCFEKMLVILREMRAIGDM